MRILVLTCMFPCKRHPTSGVFFANLIKELSLEIEELIVITPRVYIPKVLTKIKKNWSRWYLDPMHSQEGRMEIIRPYYLSLRGMAFDGINGMLMHYSLRNLFRKIINAHKIDLILGYNMLPEGIAAVRLAKTFHLPVGFWAIGTDVNDFAKYNKVNHYLSKKCIEDSDIIIAESKDLESKIRQFTTTPINANTFYKGIDISTFRNLPSRNSLLEKLKFSPDKKYLLYAGRLIYDKGIYELAEAFKLIAKKYRDIDLIMVGEEIEKDKFQKIINDDGLLSRVHFQGIISHMEVAHFMKISHLLVLPTWAEGLPNVVMEAMAVGLPVVATNVGGIPEILKNGVTGISVPAKNVEKLTEAIVSMLEDNHLRVECSLNAQKLMVEHFDVKKNVFKLLEYLKNMKTHYA